MIHHLGARVTFCHTKPTQSVNAISIRYITPSPPLPLMTTRHDRQEVRRVDWSEMASSWDTLLQGSKMDMDDGLTGDNFICADGYDKVLLRFWFASPQATACRTVHRIPRSWQRHQHPAHQLSGH